MEFKRIMPNIKNQIGVDKNSFWIITSYGRTFWNIKKQRYFKEVILINAPDKSYTIKNWNFSKIIKAEIPEEKSFLFRLGSLINTKGQFISIPHPDKNFRIYPKSGISIHPKYNYHTEGLYEILKNTSYPLADNSSELYNNAPYYKVLSFGTEVIVPIHVITSYFYYLSTLCSYHIIYDNIKHSIFNEREIEGAIVVPFSGNIIRHQEAKILAKYLFIKGSKKLNYLRDIPKNSLNKLYNGDKFNHKARFYLKSEIPFDGYTKFNFIGQYITEKDGVNPRKFLVHDITKVSLFEENKMFSLGNYLMYNLSDQRSIPVENPESIEGYNGVRYVHNNEKDSFIGDSITNHNAGIKDLSLIESHGLFLDSPKNSLIDKSEQSIKYKLENTIIRNTDRVSDNLRNHSGTSTSVRSNVSPSIINQFHEILNEVIIELKNTTGYDANYIVLESHNGSFSYPPVGIEKIGTIIILSIIYNKKNYCLIDSGYETYIALFRLTDPTIAFEDYNDPNINDALTEMILNQDYKWKEAFKNEVFKKNNSNIYLLEPLKHPKHEYTIEEAAKSLLKRIKERIENDV